MGEFARKMLTLLLQACFNVRIDISTADPLLSAKISTSRHEKKGHEEESADCITTIKKGTQVVGIQHS